MVGLKSACFGLRQTVLKRIIKSEICISSGADDSDFDYV